MEGFREHQLPLIVTFVDFKKAFDSINRSVMFSVLRHWGPYATGRMKEDGDLRSREEKVEHASRDVPVLIVNKPYAMQVKTMSQQGRL